VLTKSQPFYTLPPAVADLENVSSIPDQVSFDCWSVTSSGIILHATLGAQILILGLLPLWS